MIKLKKSLAAWGSSDFRQVLKDELQHLDMKSLPLQDGLSQTSYVSTDKIDAVILKVTEAKNVIIAETGIFYSGINAGSCCSDDPTPVDDQPEHCDMEFKINKKTAETKVSIINR
ncbi:MAG: hypothetical protein ACC635_05465 [Acidiferrobacterales bacterium]